MDPDDETAVELEQLRDVAACARELCALLGRNTPLTQQQHAAYSLLEDALRDLDGDDPEA